MKPTLTLLLLTLLGGSIQAQQWTTVQTHGAAGTEGA